MRLRSTHLAFLVLLLCSVQMRADCALHLAVASSIAAAPAELISPGAPAADAQNQAYERVAVLAQLFRRTDVRQVNGPARAAMAVNSFTGLLRA